MKQILNIQVGFPTRRSGQHLYRLILACGLLVLGALACNLPWPNPPLPGESIGTIEKEESDVLQNSVEVVAINNLIQDDTLSVQNGGVGLVRFGQDLSIRLFNETLAGEFRATRSASGPNSTLIARITLFTGGLTGRLVKENNTATFKTMSGAKILVKGTEFFIVYDPETMVTTIGNFSGLLGVNAGGISATLTSGYYLEVHPNRPPGVQKQIPFTLQQFENRARERESPVLALREWIPPGVAQAPSVTPSDPIQETLEAAIANNQLTQTALAQTQIAQDVGSAATQTAFKQTQDAEAASSQMTQTALAATQSAVSSQLAGTQTALRQTQDAQAATRTAAAQFTAAARLTLTAAAEQTQTAAAQATESVWLTQTAAADQTQTMIQQAAAARLTQTAEAARLTQTAEGPYSNFISVADDRSAILVSVPEEWTPVNGGSTVDNNNENLQWATIVAAADLIAFENFERESGVTISVAEGYEGAASSEIALSDWFNSCESWENNETYEEYFFDYFDLKKYSGDVYEFSDCTDRNTAVIFLFMQRFDEQPYQLRIEMKANKNADRHAFLTILETLEIDYDQLPTNTKS